MTSHSTSIPNAETHASSGERNCPSCKGSSVSFQREMGNERILECKDCSAAFSARVPMGAEVSAIYEKMYAAGSPYQSHRDEVSKIRSVEGTTRFLKVGWERRYFFSKVPPVKGQRLLDIGCGTGYFLTAAAQQGWDSSGIEPSSEAAALGSAVHKRTVHVGRIEEAALENSSLGAVTAWEVLEHIPEPLDFLRQIHGLLQPTGVFAGSVPNYARPRYRFGTDLGPSSVPPVHLNFWGPESLAALLRRAGFVEVHVVVPQLAWDVLRPVRRPSFRKLWRFLMIAIGRDLPTTMAFTAVRC